MAPTRRGHPVKFVEPRRAAAKRTDGRTTPVFVGVAWLEALPPGRAMTVAIGDMAIALFNVDDTIYAIDDACLHAGASLGSGQLDGKIVRCGGHGWKYDVTTGCVVGVPELRVATREVKVVDGRIMVAIESQWRGA